MISTGKELAAKVAEQIRTHGHYQGQASQEGDPTACLIANDYVLHTARSVRNDYYEQLCDALGLDRSTGVGVLVRFNDTHTTSEVLAVLDHVAQGAAA